MPSDRLLSTDPQAGQLLSSDPVAGARQPNAAVPQRHIGTVFGRPLKPEIDAQLRDVQVMGEPLYAPVGAARAAASLIPSAVRAGQKFESVMAAAKDVPIDISAPGNVALRIQQLSERGASMPKAVRDFLKRATDPEKGEITYKEARDFASNISRLSANEFSRLTPVVANEVHKLRIALNGAVETAARQVGKGDEYLSAMKEYARAARVRKAAESAKRTIQRYILPAGAGYYALDKLSDMVRGDR